MSENDTISRTRKGFRIAIGAYVFCVVLAVTPFTMDPAGDIKRLLLGVFAAGLSLAWLTVTWARRLPVRRPICWMIP